MRTMKNLFASLFAICFLSSTFAQQFDLPKGMTEQEKLIMDDYLSTFNDKGITTPPPFTNIRNMGEWEEVEALVITWTNSFNTIQSEIVDAAQEECIVIIHCTDSNQVKTILSNNGVPDSNLEFIEAPYDSIWIRDYFGNTCYSNYVEDRFFVDWIYNRPRPDDDALVDDYTGPYMGIDVYSMTANPNKIMATGGNWMTDGDSIAFSSELIIDENDGTGDYGLNYPNHTLAEVETLFSDWMGVTDYIKMTVLPYDDIHHIDMHMKLLDEETLLIGEYPAGQSDGPQIEANLQYVLSNYTTKFGTPFKVYRIPQPSSVPGNYPPNAYYRTYANQTFVNNTVLLPTYREEYDTTALGILDTILPGYNIVPIDVDNSGQNLIAQGGAIHCITHTVGVSDPIYISHKKLENTTDDINDYQAEAFIKHVNGIQSASIWYKTSLTGSYTEVPMTNSSGDDWTGLIPAQAVGTTVYYYIEGTAVGGKQITHPMTAPDGYHKFKVYGSGSGGGSGVIENNPLNMDDIYPNPASAITVIPVNTGSNVTNAKISLINMLGEEVEVIHQGMLPQGKQNFFIDASQYANGMYQVLIQSGDFKVYQKLVIQK